MNEQTTIWNKIYSALLILFGVCFAVEERDLSFLIFSLIIGFALFFCNENVIGD